LRLFRFVRGVKEEREKEKARSVKKKRPRTIAMQPYSWSSGKGGERLGVMPSPGCFGKKKRGGGGRRKLYPGSERGKEKERGKRKRFLTPLTPEGKEKKKEEGKREKAYCIRGTPSRGGKVRTSFFIVKGEERGGIKRS